LSGTSFYLHSAQQLQKVLRGVCYTHYYFHIYHKKGNQPEESIEFATTAPFVHPVVDIN